MSDTSVFNSDEEEVKPKSSKKEAVKETVVHVKPDKLYNIEMLISLKFFYGESIHHFKAGQKLQVDQNLLNILTERGAIRLLPS